MKSNIIVTGPPRSGTTLTCFLLNKTHNTIALNEPMNLKMFNSKTEGIKNTTSFFNQMRLSLLSDGTAIARQVGGKVPDNMFTSKSQNKVKLRMNLATKGIVKFEKELTKDFKLILKHNAHFTFLINELIQDFQCFAIIRNPLATIASWNTISAPVSKGNLKVLKSLDADLYNKMERIPDLVDRQVRLLHELFKCYSILESDHIIRYEDVISSRGKILANISKESIDLNEDLESKNDNFQYDSKIKQEIVKKLLSFDGAYWDYYEKEELSKYLDTKHKK